MKKHFILWLLTVACMQATAQNHTTLTANQKSILFTQATIHNGRGEVLTAAALGFKNGKITYIGTDTKLPVNDYDTVINCGSKHIYPGFIGMNTQMGLVEIEAVRATIDAGEVGDINPSARSVIAYNTDNKSIATVRCDGVLMCQVVPQRGLVSGQSSVMKMDGWNWEDAAYKIDEGIIIHWPRMMLFNAWWASSPEEQQQRTERQLLQLKNLFDEARAYYMSKGSGNINLDAMCGLFNHSKKLYVEAYSVREIIAAVAFGNSYGVSLVIVGGIESCMVADLLKKHNIPVIIKGTHTLPATDDTDIRATYKLPALLQQAGITYCISVEGFWQVRTLGYQAGQAVAYGITAEEALTAITYTPAKILGIDASCGSLEKGKDATLFISEGDALDMRTNKISWAFIAGKPVDLDNVQKQLYRKYLDKFGLHDN
ncbi:MAG: amidohydrolase family protein [Bacteroidia bacterium]|nr:amidohydrolase family protein [Bacteroidia bacterium]